MWWGVRLQAHRCVESVKWWTTETYSPAAYSDSERSYSARKQIVMTAPSSSAAVICQAAQASWLFYTVKLDFYLNSISSTRSIHVLLCGTIGPLYVWNSTCQIENEVFFSPSVSVFALVFVCREAVLPDFFCGGWQGRDADPGWRWASCGPLGKMM